MTKLLNKYHPDTPFTTDGCSGGMSWLWRKVLDKSPPWEGACIEHDKAYWYGGTKQQRLNADRQLASQVALQGYPIIGMCMYYAVRLGGMPYWSFSWRWNYGSKKKEYRE